MESIGYFLAFVTMYFLPAIFAPSGRRASVFVVNAAFGWTFIGWFIALYMAVRAREAVKAGV